jgi:hypothetical protein
MSSTEDLPEELKRPLGRIIDSLNKLDDKYSGDVNKIITSKELQSITEKGNFDIRQITAQKQLNDLNTFSRGRQQNVESSITEDIINYLLIFQNYREIYLIYLVILLMRRLYFYQQFPYQINHFEI